MRKLLPFLLLISMCDFSCKQPIDPIAAEVFHHKLYLSEIKEKIPSFASKEDSLQFLEQYVEEWLFRQTLLAKAKQGLTQKEQEFSSQIEQYKEQLLLNAYFQKISNNITLAVSKKELDEFLKDNETDEKLEYIDMVKLNYIKLSNPSKHYKKIKDLFFDDMDRATSLAQIELLCADTIEYYLDSEPWFYADFLEKEFPFSFSSLAKQNLQEKFDIVENGNRYLIIILDKKQQLQPKDVFEDRKMAQSLIQQQKRVAFISNYQDSLVKKALRDKKAVRYQIYL